MTKKRFAFVGASGNAPLVKPEKKFLFHILLLPDKVRDDHAEAIEQLERLGVRTTIIHSAPQSYEGVDRVLVIIPRQESEVAAQIRSDAMKAAQSVQVSHASSGRAVTQLREDMGLD